MFIWTSKKVFKSNCLEVWNETKENKSVPSSNSYFKSLCVDIGDLWFKLFEPVSFYYYYVSDCNNDNNGNNKIQEKEKYRTGLKSFKPKNEICCWLQYTTCKVLWTVKTTVVKILFALW